ncbi:MAG: hypothetical protein K9K67_13860 [Bacteriovoracaceae bacterium]|nr:hypothetical protein [Bacteriovoracaceae bacterium]
MKIFQFEFQSAALISLLFLGISFATFEFYLYYIETKYLELVVSHHKETKSELSNTEALSLVSRADLINSVIKVRIGDKHVLYKLNSHGFRESEEKNKVCVNENCICIFGGSRVLGAGVNDKGTYSSLLEKKLQKPTYNFGIGGADPAKVLHTLVEANKKFNCKISLLEVQKSGLSEIFFPYDIFGNHKYYYKKTGVGYEAPKMGYPNKELQSIWEIRKYVDFSRSFKIAFRWFYLNYQYWKYGSGSNLENVEETDEFYSFKKSLITLRSIFKEKKRELIIFSRHSVFLRDSKICPKNDCIDISSVNINAFEINKYFGHINEEGHNVISETIYEHMNKNTEKLEAKL